MGSVEDRTFPKVNLLLKSLKWPVKQLWRPPSRITQYKTQ